MSTEGAIRADSLTKTYCSGGAEVVVFRNLSLRIERGERLAIIGESGAGKSTLLHLLGGLDRPSSGRIYFGDSNIVAFTEQELSDFRNRELGFVWQNPFLLPEFTALENVMMPLLIRGVEPDKAAKSARARLEEVGLRSRESHRSGELSGGEQQRVALARALVGEPGVLLADEPTGNLDFRTGEMIIALLAEMHEAHGLTSVFVTHNIAFATRCDRVLELRKGILQTPSELELQEAGMLQDATRLDGGAYV
ncbi:MAG: ABC transporter ATP-binding protein [Acidobacteriaceae bacterium]|nr:ABC transporter ATP-binding protein [Acidobacteriaceae bacterium]MBV9297327.1 ABC transporter ATP-binding protein [Acidobacteriaceae bacterium]MBV9764516.1 ABC transporter ATP-binding protein [Acidobacteriaceae bacterium]